MAAGRIARATALAALVTSGCGFEYWRTFPPETPDRVEVFLPELEHERLPSQLTVITAQTADAGVLRMTLVVRGGYGEDPPGLEGLARLSATTLGVLAEAPVHADRFAALGTTPEIDVGRRDLAIAIEVLPEDGAAGASALAAFLAGAVVDTPMLDRARALQGAAWGRSLGSPDALAALAMARSFAPPQGTSPTLGLASDESYARITARDVDGYVRRALDLRTSALVVTGPVGHQSVANWTTSAFAGWPRLAQLSPAKHASPRAPGGAEVVFVPIPGMVQAMIVVGGACPIAADPEQIAFVYARSLVLSRLGYTMREELHASYGFDHGVSVEDGVFAAPIRVRADRTRATLGFLWTALEVGPRTDRLADDWPEQAGAAASMRLMEAAQSGAYLTALARDVFADGRATDSLRHTLQAVRQLEISEVAAAAKRWLQRDRLRIVVVGDPALVRSQLPRDAEVWTPESLREPVAQPPAAVGQSGR